MPYAVCHFLKTRRGYGNNYRLHIFLQTTYFLKPFRNSSRSSWCTRSLLPILLVFKPYFLYATKVVRPMSRNFMACFFVSHFFNGSKSSLWAGKLICPGIYAVVFGSKKMGGFSFELQLRFTVRK